MPEIEITLKRLKRYDCCWNRDKLVMYSGEKESAPLSHILKDRIIGASDKVWLIDMFLKPKAIQEICSMLNTILLQDDHLIYLLDHNLSEKLISLDGWNNIISILIEIHQLIARRQFKEKYKDLLWHLKNSFKYRNYSINPCLKHICNMHTEYCNIAEWQMTRNRHTLDYIVTYYISVISDLRFAIILDQRMRGIQETNFSTILKNDIYIEHAIKYLES